MNSNNNIGEYIPHIDEVYHNIHKNKHVNYYVRSMYGLLYNIICISQWFCHGVISPRNVWNSQTIYVYMYGISRFAVWAVMFVS
jgi:hypothetical protein